MGLLTRFMIILATLGIVASLTFEPAAAADIKIKKLDVKQGGFSPRVCVSFSNGAWRVNRALIDLDVHIRSKNQAMRRVVVQPGGNNQDRWIQVWSGKEWGLHWSHLNFDLRGSDLGMLAADGFTTCSQKGTGNWPKKFRVRFSAEDWRNRWAPAKARDISGFVRCNTGC